MVFTCFSAASSICVLCRLLSAVSLVLASSASRLAWCTGDGSGDAVHNERVAPTAKTWLFAVNAVVVASKAVGAAAAGVSCWVATRLQGKGHAPASVSRSPRVRLAARRADLSMLAVWNAKLRASGASGGDECSRGNDHYSYGGPLEQDTGPH